jgi:hypothetical protein
VAGRVLHYRIVDKTGADLQAILLSSSEFRQ